VVHFAFDFLCRDYCLLGLELEMSEISDVDGMGCGDSDPEANGAGAVARAYLEKWGNK